MTSSYCEAGREGEEQRVVAGGNGGGGGGGGDRGTDIPQRYQQFGRNHLPQ